MTLEELIERSKAWPHKDIEMICILDGKEYVVETGVATQTRLLLKLNELRASEGIIDAESGRPPGESQAPTRAR